MSQSILFKWRHFEPEIILLCLRWYLRYSLSYRDLEEMMNERGLSVDHTTIYRWVQAYAPELEKRRRPHRPVLRQNLIPMPNVSHWSHITPVNSYIRLSQVIETKGG